MNLTARAEENTKSPRTRGDTAHRAATLALALASLFALPATAGDTTAPGRPSIHDIASNRAEVTARKTRFAFTGMYRFSTRRAPPADFPPPRLTTGSLPPPPVKPNEPPTGTLGGPSPADAAISPPSKSETILAGPRNPRHLDHSVRSTGNIAARPFKRISRADIAPSTPAGISEPLPALTAPTDARPPDAAPAAAEPIAQAAPRRAPSRITMSRRRGHVSRYQSGDWTPAQHPKWFTDAWRSDK